MRRWAWLVALSLCWSADVPAQEEEESEDLLDEEFALLEDSEKVFSASRHEESILESPATVTVITRQQIENTHCLDIACILRGVPELEVRQMNPFHHSVGARALASEANDKVLLLVDGREDNIEALGIPLWQILGLHLEDIERIEVVRGPASALYGANAHSLVVNVTTRRPKDDRAELFAGAGELGRLSLNGFAHGMLGGWRLGLRAGREEQQEANRWQEVGVRARDTNWIGLQAERDWQLGTSTLDASYSSVAGMMIINFAPTQVRNSSVARVSLEHRADWLRLRAWYQLMHMESFFDLPVVYGDTKLGSFTDWFTWLNHAADIEAQATHSFFADNLLVAGANYRWLGMFLESNRPEWVEQHRVGVFVHDEQRLGNFLLVAGARLDYNSITPLTLSPRAAVVWRYADDQSLRVAFGRAFRKPSFLNTSLHLGGIHPEPGFEELVVFFANSLGNEELSNENVNSFELGWRGYFLDGKLNLEADAFFNMYRDLIAFTFHIVEDNFGVINLAQSWIRYENRGWNINSGGGSLSAVYCWNDALRLSANYTYRYSWYLSEGSGTTLYGKGDRVPWEPAHLFNASADLKLKSGLRLGLALHVRSAFWERWAKGGGLFGKDIRVNEPARALLGGYLGWRLVEADGWLEFGLRAQNLLGERWRDMTGVTRFDGAEVGGLFAGRLVLAYLRAGI